MIQQIGKAKRYAEEPERIQSTRFEPKCQMKRCPLPPYDDGACNYLPFFTMGDCTNNGMQRNWETFQLPIVRYSAG